MPIAKARLFLDLLRRRRSYFRHDAFDQDLVDRIMAMPTPDNLYTIFFTPRSGSTRVTRLIGDAKLSNHPGEFFNEYFMDQIAQRHSARSLKEYVDLIQRHRQRGGHFGFENTYKQLAIAFRTGDRFLSIVKPDHTAWLMREDIIAQAVSGSRLVQTQVPHAPTADQATLEHAEQAFVYDASQIASIIKRVMWMEARTEALIKRADLDTFRFSYEMTNKLGPERTTGLLASRIGLPVPGGQIAELHTKLPGTKGREFAERFRAEHPTLISKVGKRRAPLLAMIEKQKEKYL